MFLIQFSHEILCPINKMTGEIKHATMRSFSSDLQALVNMNFLWLCKLFMIMKYAYHNVKFSS